MESFEVEADAGDGGLEFVGDGVEEGVLSLVAADLTDDEDGVRTTPATRIAKKMMPRTRSAKWPSLWMIQVMLRKTVRPVSSTPSVMKTATVPRRRLIFMPRP